MISIGRCRGHPPPSSRSRAILRVLDANAHIREVAVRVLPRWHIEEFPYLDSTDVAGRPKVDGSIRILSVQVWQPDRISGPRVPHPHAAAPWSSRFCLKYGCNVLPFEIGHLFENLLRGQTCCQQIQDICNPNSHSPNTGATPTLVWIECDSVQQARHLKFQPLLENSLLDFK
jgi:hypothetical protein